MAQTQGTTSRHNDPLAQKLDTLQTTLKKIDQSIGRGDVEIPFLADLMRIGEELADMVDKVAPEARARLREIIGFVRTLPAEIEGRLARFAPSKEIPSYPLFGVLPVARAIPQDIHSVIDYMNGGGAMIGALLADSLSGKIASVALGTSAAGVSLMTDYRLSAAKVIPIEAHEVIDHVWGLSAIAAPFLFGYWKKDPAVAATHMMLGATTILVSLFTDYRAAKGVGHEEGPSVKEAAVQTSKIVGIGKGT